jgi:hypothetical protein
MLTPADTATIKANQFSVAGEELEQEDVDSLSPNADASALQSTFDGVGGEARDGVETPLSEDGRLSVGCAFFLAFVKCRHDELIQFVSPSSCSNVALGFSPIRTDRPADHRLIP